MVHVKTYKENSRSSQMVCSLTSPSRAADINYHVPCPDVWITDRPTSSSGAKLRNILAKIPIDQEGLYKLAISTQNDDEVPNTSVTLHTS